MSRRIGMWVVLPVVLMAAVAEIAARGVFGLGDPPLYSRDPEIEYLYKPSARYRYLHHEIVINSHSMRSAEFAAARTSPDELRVMVIGDSIVTGGGRVDQTEIATELLRSRLGQSLRRPVVVGNIAAASWGTPNQLAFVRRFGLFDADVVLLVLNSGDADDVPGLEAIGAAYPEHTPVLALQEPGRRMLQRFAPGVCERLGLLTPAHRNERGEFLLSYEQRCEQAAAALMGLIEVARSSGARVGAIQYWKLSELRAGKPDSGHARIGGVLESRGVPIWQSAGESPKTADASLFLSNDEVHPSAAGHAGLAAVFEAAVRALLADGSEKPPAGGRGR